MNAEHELKRAAMLIEMDRFAQAEAELAAVLARDPDSSDAHQMLAECHIQQDRTEKAEEAAKEAIRCDPGDYGGYLTLARALCNDPKRRGDAQAAITESLQLAPYDPFCHAIQAVLLIHRRDWKGALGSCDAGLQLDPENTACLHFRALALQRSGRLAEAKAVLDYSLSKNPLNEYTHAQSGWTCLARGDSAGASWHFTEALRLNPDSDTARQGMIEAIKTQNFVYRQWFSFLLWMNRFSGRVQLIAFVVLIIGMNYFRSFLSEGPPSQQYLALGIGVAYMLFVFLVWTSGPLTNLLLRIHPLGRHLLTVAQRWATVFSVIYLCGAGAMTAALLSLVALGGTGLDAATIANIALLGLIYAMLLIPVSSAFASPPGRGRNISILACIVLTTAAYPVTIFAILTNNKQLLDTARDTMIYGLVAFTWIRSILGAAEE